MDLINIYKKQQLEKFNQFKKKYERKSLLDFLVKFNYSLDIIDEIFNKKYINKIQNFFRRYRLSDKTILNNNNSTDIIKFRHNNNIYGCNLDKLYKSIELYENINPINAQFYNGPQYDRLKRIVYNLNKFKYETMSEFFQYNGTYFNNSDNWIDSDFYNLFQTKGKNEIQVPRDMFEKMLDLNPCVYAIEIFSNDIDNSKKSYASFYSLPNDKDHEVELPFNVLNQLKTHPIRDNTFDMRIVKPPKAKKLYLRSFLNKKNLVKDIEKTFTQEIQIHKILSVGQIIVLESDIDNQMIPFLVEKIEPSNVVDTTNVDVEVDFLPAMEYDEPMFALMMELNKQ